MIWPDAWDTVAPLFAGSGTRIDTGRRFTSLALAKLLGGLTWPDAAAALGVPARGIPTFTANVVNRLTVAGTLPAFHAAVADLAADLADGIRPLVDWTARRRTLIGLRRGPARLLQDGRLVGTDPRRRKSRRVALGRPRQRPPVGRPRLGRRRPTPNQREVYRRFVRDDLPRLEAPLGAWGEGLLC